MKRNAWLVALVLVGLVARVALLRTPGTHDVAYDVAWGRATNTFGFAHYYYGNYFPLQYHVFQLASGLSRRLPLSGTTTLKTINLLFDVALFAAIAVLARRLGWSRWLPLIYWLAPYTLVMDWLGYMDFQMGLFAVLGVLFLTGGRRARDLVPAGFAFGAAMMMKPQALTLLVMLVGLILFGLVRVTHPRDLLRDGGLLAIGPFVFFLGYSVWLHEGGHGLTYLAHTLIDFGKFQGPALSANETNLWVVFAEIYKQGGQPIYAVTGPHYHSLQGIAIGMTLVLALVALVAVARGINDRPFHESVILVFAAGTLTLPMTMTRAHENHLFLGLLFGLLAIPLLGRAFGAAIGVLMIIQTFALVAIYGFDGHAISSGLSATLINDLWAPLGAITFAAFCVAYVLLIKGAITDPRITGLPSHGDVHARQLSQAFEPT